MSEAALAPRSREPALASPLAIAAGAAMLFSIVLRVSARPNLPLWLDEAWTGAMIAQPSLVETLRQTLLDANAPLYFAIAHLWSLASGFSNGALRFPSLILGVAAPLLALIPVKAIPRDARLLWSALLALWFPGILYSQEARCYALLFFLSVASIIALARLLEQPDLRRALLWSVVGALAILTHYHAVILIGLQGLTYLAAHRGRALRTWLAILAFVPAFAWFAVHLPHLIEYTDPRFAWFDRLASSDIPRLVLFMLGGIEAMLGLIVVAMMVLVLYAAAPGAAAERGAEPEPPGLWLAAATSALGAVLLIAVAMHTHSFTTRYLIPFVPGLMLAIALAGIRAGRRFATIPLLVALVFVTSAASRTLESRERPAKVYNFEGASELLMARGVRHLAFFWDNPLNRIADPRQLSALAGFFFGRAGATVSIALPVRPGEDPNISLLADANMRPDSGILWIYDLSVRGTAANSLPPQIEQRDRAWRCRQLGLAELGVLTCLRR